MKFYKCAAVALATFCGVAQAAPVLDQYFDVFKGNFSFGPAFNMEQQVTSGIGGVLSKIELYSGGFSTVPFVLSINKGLASESDVDDFAVEKSLNSGWNTFDVSLANISLLAGDKFSIGIKPLGGLVTLGFSSSDYYQGGALYSNNDILFGDLMFRTYMDQGTQMQPVPEPSSMLLAGLGLGALVLCRRNRRI